MTGGKLKPGWKVWRFEQMATNVNVRIDNPSESGMEHYVGLEHLDPDSLRIRRWGSPCDVEAGKLFFKTGDIIFAKRRAYQRKLGVAEFDGICSAHAMVLRAKPEVVLPEFLAFFMQSDLFMNRAVEISVGSLSPTINWKTMAVQEFALPPKGEQRRFVEVIAATDRSLDALHDLFLATHAALSSMMEHVANTWAVCETRQLQHFANSGKNSFVNGPFGSDLLTSELTNSGVPVIYVRDIKPNRYLRVSPSHVTEEKADRLIACNVLHGDVLVAKVGDPPGWAAPYFSDHRSIVTQDVIRIRPAADVDSVFLAALLNSRAGIRGIQSIKISGTRERFPLTQFKKLLLPKPPLSVQKEIANVVSEFMGAFDLAEKRAEGTRRLRARLLTELFQCS